MAKHLACCIEVFIHLQALKGCLANCRGSMQVSPQGLGLGKLECRMGADRAFHYMIQMFPPRILACACRV